MSIDEKIKNHYTKMIVSAAASAKIGALLGQADASVATRNVSLPPPGQAPIVEKYTADEADDYYSADARNYALIAKELIRTGGTALPFDPVFLSKTAMNAI
jgi:hypothetical protein